MNRIMTNPYANKRVAILIEDGVEDVEFQVPYQAMKSAGFEVVVLGSRLDEKIKGKQGKVAIKPDSTTTQAEASQFDAVIVPGGQAPDTMRVDPSMVNFVREAIEQGKLVAAVCHEPQVLINGDLLKGKRATGFIAIRQDMINAGANYIDEPLVVDGNLLTSQQPGDLAIFTTAILSRLGYGGKEAQLPHENDTNAEWGKIADAWGGSSKKEIINALNQALAGERYAQETFEKYLDNTDNADLRSHLQEMIQHKQQTIQTLEARLDHLGEKPSLKTKAADAYAKLKTTLEGNNDLSLLSNALRISEIGVADAYNLRKQY